MKKLILLALAIFIMTSTALAQLQTKKTVLIIANRASTMGVAIKKYDFIYIIADSAMYYSKVDLGPNATGTYLTASTARYGIAKIAVGRNALTGTTGDFASTLGVTGDVGIGTTDRNKFTVAGTTGNTAIAGTLSAAGAIGFGASYNKFTVAAATGNTAIAGTLSTTGVATLASCMVGATGLGLGLENGKFQVTPSNGNTSIGGTLAVTGAASFTAAPIMSAGVRLSTSDTITSAAVGTLCYKLSDSTLYLKVKATGTTGARWRVCTIAR